MNQFSIAKRTQKKKGKTEVQFPNYSCYVGGGGGGGGGEVAAAKGCLS